MECIAKRRCMRTAQNEVFLYTSSVSSRRNSSSMFRSLCSTRRRLTCWTTRAKRFSKPCVTNSRIVRSSWSIIAFIPTICLSVVWNAEFHAQVVIIVKLCRDGMVTIFKARIGRFVDGYAGLTFVNNALWVSSGYKLTFPSIRNEITVTKIVAPTHRRRNPEWVRSNERFWALHSGCLGWTFALFWISRTWWWRGILQPMTRQIIFIPSLNKISHC